jgi:hypothetical protein
MSRKPKRKAPLVYNDPSLPVRPHIENRLHYVKDVTLGEDHSTIHKDNGPKIMAALRNTVVSLLRRAGFSTIAARMRYNSIHPEAALAVLSLSLV